MEKGFIYLPGAQGLGTNVGKPMPMFGSEESPMQLPDYRMTEGHFVVSPKGFSRKVSTEEKTTWQADQKPESEFYQEAQVVGKISKQREPRNPVVHRLGRFRVPPVLIEGCAVMDAQAAFYVAANEIRNNFILFSQDTLETLDLDLRKMATLVTIVDSAIHARPIGIDKECEENEKGFEVVCEFRQFVTLGMPYAEIQEYSIFSEKGEFPICVPKDVEMGMLLRMDKQVMNNPIDVKKDMTPQERAARLLNKLKGV